MSIFMPDQLAIAGIGLAIAGVAAVFVAAEHLSAKRRNKEAMAAGLPHEEATDAPVGQEATPAPAVPEDKAVGPLGVSETTQDQVFKEYAETIQKATLELRYNIVRLKDIGSLESPLGKDKGKFPLTVVQVKKPKQPGLRSAARKLKRTLSLNPSLLSKTSGEFGLNKDFPFMSCTVVIEPSNRVTAWWNNTDEITIAGGDIGMRQAHDDAKKEPISEN